MTTQPATWTQTRFPILALLNPREYTWLLLATLGLGAALGTALVRVYRQPLWVAVAAGLALLLLPGVLKWRADARRYGYVVMALGMLLVAQGFHGAEHAAQWLQYHVLNWSARASTGLLSPANSEWVHFVWNWTVLVLVVALIAGGMRNRWAWLLLLWAAAHTLEHTYMFTRYLEVLAELRRMGVTKITAQGLPGILGQDGWLARSDTTQGTFLCRLPAVTTAIRLDVHFWWNVGETVLLALAAHAFLRKQPLHERPVS
ncbi:MAG TPA: hypothetical protein PLO33_13470 [Kouleothrix sp.]|uniref:hypothetical protein n=1 Tax=Kouleothrix sp. TaxID=2779161 RepID=UPI002BE77A32|nr:hypothetical protein [Kouleothrix sp.]